MHITDIHTNTRAECVIVLGLQKCMRHTFLLNDLAVSRREALVNW